MKENIEAVSLLSRRRFLTVSAQLSAALWLARPLESLAVPLIRATEMKEKRDQHRILTIEAKALARKKAVALHSPHTGEYLELFTKKGGEDNRDCLKRIQRFMRDHRTGEQHRIDLELIDMLADIQHGSGKKGPFEVLSGYRSPKTNAMLRKQTRGVARRSYHMTGQAIDIRLPGVSTRKLRNIALSLKRGGVGYYPKSKFVHIDTGPVRTW